MAQARTRVACCAPTVDQWPHMLSFLLGDYRRILLQAATSGSMAPRASLLDCAPHAKHLATDSTSNHLATAAEGQRGQRGPPARHLCPGAAVARGCRPARLQGYACLSSLSECLVHQQAGRGTAEGETGCRWQGMCGGCCKGHCVCRCPFRKSPGCGAHGAWCHVRASAGWAAHVEAFPQWSGTALWICSEGVGLCTAVTSTASQLHVCSAYSWLIHTCAAVVCPRCTQGRV